MRAVVYRETGSAADVLEVVDRPVPTPGPGEARVRVVRAGVNPTDWKFRANGMNGAWDEVVPGQDGAGVVEEIGPGVTEVTVGDRVWTILAQYQRPGGTAAEHTVQPVSLLVRLPDDASFDLGASRPSPRTGRSPRGRSPGSPQARSRGGRSWSPAAPVRWATRPSSWPGGPGPRSSRP
jgi:NADPH:quinone reductase